MTTQRQLRDGLDTLHGAHVHLHITTSADHTTTLHNTILRGEFATPDGRPVHLKAGPRVTLYALLSYGRERADPAWRLDMTWFAAENFVETKTTVYGWIRVLEETGFVVRHRVNSAETGQFEWHLDIADRPGVLPGAAGNPQVRPSLQKGGDGAAPPVDNSETTGQTIPTFYQDGKNPEWENRHTVTSYREILTKRLPATTSSSATCERETAEEAAAGRRSLSVVRPVVPVAGEDGVAPEPDWVDWIRGLLDRPAVIAARPLRPPARDLDLIAVRAQVAVERLGWTRQALATRVLLVRLDGVEHLGGVWLARLHPERLGPAPVDNARTRVEQGQRDQDPMAREVPDDARRAEIRALHGQPRGKRWADRMSGE